MALIGISGKIGSGKDTIGKIIQWLVDQDGQAFIKDIPFDKPTTIKDCVDFIKSGEDLQYPDETSWQIKKYAGKLKQIVSLLTGISLEDLEKEEIKNKGLGEEWRRWVGVDNIGQKHLYLTQQEATMNFSRESYLQEITPRFLLQTLGTEAGRNLIHPNLWVNALFADYTPEATTQLVDIQLGMSTSQMEKIGKPIPIWFPNWIITDVRFPNEKKAIEDRGGIVIRVSRKTWVQKQEDRLLKEYNYKQEHPSETALDNAEFDYVIDNNGTIEDLIEKVKEILIKEKII